MVRTSLAMCEALNILPLNHCIYYDKSLDGDFTYHKSGKRSQIDFILTDNRGRRFVNIFDIVKTGWHASDHLPLDLQIKLNWKNGLTCFTKTSKRTRSLLLSTRNQAPKYPETSIPL